VGGAATLLSRRRALALATLTVALVVYGAVAVELPELPTTWDAVVVSLGVLPASTAWAWIALPLARAPWRHPIVLPVVAAGLALILRLAGFESAFNVAKLACFVLVGFALLWLFDALWWVALVAGLIPWLDVWSVAAGPTRYVVAERPGIIEHVSVGSAFPGEHMSIFLGPPDVIFFALFLAAAKRFGLRVACTWAAMTGFLALTLILVVEWDVAGLPALPAICLGFLLPNADLVWRNTRTALAERE